MSFIADVETQFLSSTSIEKKISMTPSSSTFHLPLEVLLSQGGDDRLVLDSNMMNKYLSSTTPRPDVLRRGARCGWRRGCRGSSGGGHRAWW